MRKKGKIGSVRLTWQKQIRVEREAVVHGEEEQLHNRVPKDHLLPYLPPNQISLSLSRYLLLPLLHLLLGFSSISPTLSSPINWTWFLVLSHSTYSPPRLITSSYLDLRFLLVGFVSDIPID